MSYFTWLTIIRETIQWTRIGRGKRYGRRPDVTRTLT